MVIAVVIVIDNANQDSRNGRGRITNRRLSKNTAAVPLPVENRMLPILHTVHTSYIVDRCRTVGPCQQQQLTNKTAMITVLFHAISTQLLVYTNTTYHIILTDSKNAYVEYLKRLVFEITWA